MKRLFSLLFLVSALAGCVTTNTIQYTQLNPLPSQKPKEVSLIINTYPLKTPSPTVIYAHGCSGLDGAYLDWKNKLNGWGYNVVQPDSLRSRGSNSACKANSVGNVTHNDRLEDVLKTAEWVKKQPWHKGKIGVIGFSQGGMAALNLSANGGTLYAYTAETPRDVYKNTNISATVAYYPYCQPDHVKAKIPTLILVGESDDWTPPFYCHHLPKENPNIELKIYPGVHHSFDTPGLNQINRYGYMIKYDTDAAEDAEKRTKTFFEKYLKN